METKINYADCQRYLIKQVEELNCLGVITGIEWGAGADAVYDDELPDPEEININVYDENGVHYVRFHLKDKAYHDVDSIIINILIHRIFEQNGIECPYSFPLELDGISGLVNEARAMFRLKDRGEDISGFKFGEHLFYWQSKPVEWEKQPPVDYQPPQRRSRRTRNE